MKNTHGHILSLADIAVIIAAKNEEENIKGCIDSVLVACEGLAEVIVINDGSTDQTGKILEGYGSSIQVIATTGEGPSIARNKGMHHTQRSYVAFVDADCIVDSKWLRTLMSELNNVDRSFVSIGGSQHMHPHGTPWDLFHASFLECMGFASDYVHSGKNVREVDHNPTCNVLYKKDEIIHIGEFDPRLWPCEDLDLDIRLKKAGKKFLFTPDAIIYHHRPDTFMKFMKMMYRYGFGQAQLVKKFGPVQKIHFVPIMLMLLALLLYCEVSRVWVLAAIYVFLVYRSKSLIRALFYGFYLIPTMMAWNYGFFAGLFQKMKITSK